MAIHYFKRMHIDAMFRDELFHDVLRYPQIKFDRETITYWYKPTLSREQATDLLRHQETGAFVVRDSTSYEGAFGLAVKVESPPQGVLRQVDGDVTKLDMDNELIRHFLIEPCKKGVKLKGSNNEPTFPSLVALVYQHSLTKMSLPAPLLIPQIDISERAGHPSWTEQQLLEKGAACTLVYLGVVGVESLTGDGAVQYATNKLVPTGSKVHPGTTIIGIKVNKNGVTLTDNQRKLFFRRHYPMRVVMHCGTDPKGRTYNLKNNFENVDRDVGCFGLVVQKTTSNIPENECHVFAEVDLHQPASAVINFVYKAMRFANQ